MMSHLLPVIDFALLFAGDYRVGKIYVLPFLVLASICFVLCQAGIRATQNVQSVLIPAVIFVAMFLIDGLRFAIDADEAYIERMVVLGSAPWIAVYFVVTQDCARSAKTFWAIGAIFLGGALSNAFAGDIGREFIFGPNVLYRVIIFCLVTLPLFAFLPVVFGVILGTLSRGAVVTGATILVVRFARARVAWGSILAVMLSGAAAYAILEPDLSLLEDLPRYVRLYQLGTSDSISDRLEVVQGLRLEDSLAGITLREFWARFPFILYPHNAILEFLMFYGVIGLLLCVYCGLAFYRSRITENKIVMLALLIPTLFSGDVADNAAAFSAAIALSLYTMRYTR